MTIQARRCRAGSWRAAFVASLIAGMTLATSVAHAEGGARRVSAETLFEDGRRLMTAHDYAQACPKFAASQKLDPAIGTLLNLGDCYERAGKTASAWASFREAAGAADLAGDARRHQEAFKRAAALRPQLSTLTITTHSTTSVEGLSLSIDKIELDRAVLGTPIPLDPGSHTIGVKAPGRSPWNGTVTVPSGAHSLSAMIPALQAEAPPVSVLNSSGVGASSGPIAGHYPAADSIRPAGSSQRTVGLIVGGIGAVTLVTGGLLAWSASSKWSDAKDHCPNNQCETQADIQLGRDARSRANVASIVIGGGAVGVVGGALLWFLAPASARRPAAAGFGVAPVVGLHSASILLSGGF
jgi:hypothetical protein